MQGEQRGDRDCGRGVAADRFEHDRRRRDVDLAELFRDEEALFVVGDDDGGGRARDVLEAGRRLLDERLVSRQFQVLLRIAAARHRPKAGAAAATQNDWINHWNTPDWKVLNARLLPQTDDWQLAPMSGPELFRMRYMVRIPFSY